jgi:perosamine synthetase
VAQALERADAPPLSPAPIPFYQPRINEEAIQEVVATLRSGWLTTGRKTKEFEEAFSKYIGLSHAVAVNSCTAALHLALEALGLRSGQGVLVPTMTFAATAEVVRYFNATPVLVDCTPGDLNMDMACARRQLTAARARGLEVPIIIPMHYGGQVGDAAGLEELAAREHLKVVEDAAHCCPARYRHHANGPWLSVGALSQVSCFSFYANKCITTGEGGMACTSEAQLADRMRIMSLHGISRDAWKRFTAEGSWFYEITAPGFKYNLTDVASALGIHQLRQADRFHAERRRVAETYARFLADIDELELPREMPNRVHSWHLYAIRLNLERLTIDRATFIAELKSRGIGTSVHWMPLHMHPYYRGTYGFAPEDFPVAAREYARVISLPIFPDMTEQQVETVSEAIREIIAANLRPGANG